MGMRQHLVEVLERFRPILEDSDLFDEKTSELMMYLVTEAFKSGHSIGVVDAARGAREVIEGMRKDIIAASYHLGEGSEDNETLQGAWSACDTLTGRLFDSLKELGEEELH